MADFESLKTTVNESRATHVSATKTIRGLIDQRNTALASTNKQDLEAEQLAQKNVAQAADLQAGLEQARLDTEAAIADAGVMPKMAVKPAK
jgi:hypothetical protein